MYIDMCKSSEATNAQLKTISAIYSEQTRKGCEALTGQNPKDKKKFSVEFLVVDKQLTPLIGAKATDGPSYC